MTDNYRISSMDTPADERRPEQPDQEQPRSADPVSTWLWIALAFALAADLTLQAAGLQLLAIPFGAAVLGSGIALAVRHHRNKR